MTIDDIKQEYGNEVDLYNFSSLLDDLAYTDGYMRISESLINARSSFHDLLSDLQYYAEITFELTEKDRERVIKAIKNLNDKKQKLIDKLKKGGIKIV